MDVDEETGKILVGTQGSEIYEMSLIDGSNVNGSGPIVKGHFKGETWGVLLASFPQIVPSGQLEGDEVLVELECVHWSEVRAAKAKEHE